MDSARQMVRGAEPVNLTRRGVGLSALALSVLRSTPLLAQVPAQGEPLPSWNDGPARRAILRLVAEVTQPGPGFVPPPERIAVFDNDGTLWVEQPLYVEAVFALERAKALAEADPALQSKPVFKALVENDRQAIAAFTDKDLIELAFATHANMTTDAFDRVAKDWFAKAHHPRFGRLYRELVYQPQLELLAYLRANGFKTFIVSGGGVDFMRAYAEGAYGIPPEQVIGSSAKTRFEMQASGPVLLKQGEIDSVDDGPGKPENIELHIGRKPLLAFGNSDGDLQMLQYTAGGSRANLELLVHHDDAEREYAYDRASRVGKLDKAWDEAVRRGWVVVSMKRDWKTIFPPAGRP